MTTYRLVGGSITTIRLRFHRGRLGGSRGGRPCHSHKKAQNERSYKVTNFEYVEDYQERRIVFVVLVYFHNLELGDVDVVRE